MSKRKCTCCGEEKDLSEFYKGESYSDGYSNQCKECQRRKSRLRRKRKMSYKDDEDEELRDELLSQNIYIKEERENGNKYYYLLPKKCVCEYTNGMCMYCYLATRPIIKHIKKNDEDFWNENDLKELTLYRWKQKERSDRTEIIHF